MKKLVAVIVFVSLTLTTVQAQWFGKHIDGNKEMTEVTRNLSDYNGVGVGGSFDVKLVSGNEGEITIKAEENLIPYIITEVRDNYLEIKWKKGINIRSHKRILVIVPFEEISKVSLSGSGDISTDNSIINTKKLKVLLKGSGDIKLKIKTANAYANITGSGNINLNGLTDYFKASVTGSGDVSAFDLKAKKSDLTISGSGNIRNSVSDMLKVVIVGSGDIYYKGNPKENIMISGSGDIHSKN